MGFKSSKIKTPTDMTSEVIDTPDIKEFRDWRSGTTPFRPAIMAQFGHAERAANETGYSGIPSQVARKRLTDLQMGDLATAKATTLAEAATQEQQRADEIRAMQLARLSDLTAKRRQHGYTTQVGPGWGQAVGSLLGGASSVATGFYGGGGG